jgi:hypothetical protein
MCATEQYFLNTNVNISHLGAKTLHVSQMMLTNAASPGTRLWVARMNSKCWSRSEKGDFSVGWGGPGTASWVWDKGKAWSGRWRKTAVPPPMSPRGLGAKDAPPRPSAPLTSSCMKQALHNGVTKSWSHQETFCKFRSQSQREVRYGL